jgi:hypothetical protein
MDKKEFHIKLVGVNGNNNVTKPSLVILVDKP